MDAIVRRRALLAAAKVALSLTVLGCSSSAEDPTASEDDTAAEALHRHKDAGCHHHQAACDTTVTADAGVSADGLACCRTLVTSEMADAGFGMSQLPASAKKDPDITACCKAISASGWGSGGAAMSAYETARACCELTGDWSNPACTPWGPPMPPAMKAGFELDGVA